MKKLIVVLILILPMLCMSQEQTNKQTKISIGVNFSPNYSYRILKYSNELQSFVDTREKLEQASFGFNTGIAVHYSILKRLELELGVQYSRQSDMFKDIPITNVMGNTLGRADNQLRYYYLEVPLRINYLLINKKVFVYISAGISLSTFLNDKSKNWLTYNNGKKEVVTSKSGILNFNKAVIGIIGGIGLGYNLTDKLNVRLEPLYRYSLTPLADAPIDQHNYSIGCQIGINIRL